MMGSINHNVLLFIKLVHYFLLLSSLLKLFFEILNFFLLFYVEQQKQLNETFSAK